MAMNLEQIVEILVSSFKKNTLVKAIFLKGSMARNEHDIYSDIDLYCLVNEEDLEKFLPQRIQHLKEYKDLIFLDNIFIVAPQILAVYEDFTHIDLYTVTQQTINKNDEIRILYDPKGLLKDYHEHSSLSLSYDQFVDAVDDVIWFLYQYMQSSKRRNDIWCCHLLHLSFTYLVSILLYRYCPKRALLGLKTVEKCLSKEIVDELNLILNKNTVDTHKEAAILISEFLKQEKEWIFSELENPEKISLFWSEVIKYLNE